MDGHGEEEKQARIRSGHLISKRYEKLVVILSLKMPAVNEWKSRLLFYGDQARENYAL
jgi:hypothetical protein